MVAEDLKPSDILTRKAFENAIVVELGDRRLDQRAGPRQRHRAPHRRHASMIEDWEKIGYDVPLIVNMQPAGKYLGEEYSRAGGLPAVMNELIKAGRIHATR